MARIKLGDEVKDMISGYRGIAVAVTTWLNGCVRVTIQPEGVTKEGATRAAESFDEEQLQLVKAGKVQPVSNAPPAEVPRAKAGGPKPEPRRGGVLR
jgi:hypothetical protein